MAILLQSENSFAKYLVWCGVCTDNSDVEYDLTSTDKILQVVEFLQMVHKRCWYNCIWNFWDFKKLKVGHAYLIIYEKETVKLRFQTLQFHLVKVMRKTK